MKPLALQTPKPSLNRSRSKETPQSKRSETGSNDPKVNYETLAQLPPQFFFQSLNFSHQILSKGSSSNLSELSEKDASDSSSSKVKQQKIAPKSLNLYFEAVSEDLTASTSDPPLFSPDLDSSVEDQDLTSWISPQSTISSEIVQGGAPSGKVVVSVESKEAGMVTDLLKESILEFKSSSTNLLDALRVDVDREKRETGGWSDPIFLMKLQTGLSLFLVFTVTLSNFVLASVISSSGEEEWTGFYPT